MAGFFDSAPATTSTGTSSLASSGLPDWYTQLLQGIGQTGVDYANEGYTPYTGARVAGMTDGQSAAQTGALNIANNGNPMMPAATTAINNGLSAVGTPAQTWNSSTASQYMSPYTSSVVDEIGRLGDQNFNENLAPAVQDAFIGSGGSGSTRNADIFARTARDSAANTLGLQNTALNTGYTNAQTAFNADANRALQQQTTAGQLGVSAGSTLGSLGANQQQTGLAALGLENQIGTQDQTTNQKALDTSYGDFTDQRDWDINNAAKLTQLYRGLPLPTDAVTNTTKTTTDQAAGSSTAQGLTALLGTIGGVLAPDNSKTATGSGLSASNAQALISLINSFSNKQ